MEPTLIVVGSFLTILMSVNAFFLKDILNNLQELKIELAKLLTDHSNYSALVDRHDREIDKMKERLHTLEGRDAQMMKFIDDYSK
jgi:formyltetrahydrofolate hydrolase